MSRDNPLLDLWRQADDQWAREWVEIRSRYERWVVECAAMMIAEANRLEEQEAEPLADTGDERHGDWEHGRVERW